MSVWGPVSVSNESSSCKAASDFWAQSVAQSFYIDIRVSFLLLPGFTWGKRRSRWHRSRWRRLIRRFMQTWMFKKLYSRFMLAGLYLCYNKIRNILFLVTLNRPVKYLVFMVVLLTHCEWRRTFCNSTEFCDCHFVCNIFVLKCVLECCIALCRWHLV